MIQGQALGELAVFGPIGRTYKAVELLPEVVVSLLASDFGKQFLLTGAALFVALQLGAQLTLALIERLALLAEVEQLIVQLATAELGLRRRQQLGQGLLTAGFARLGLSQQRVQARPAGTQLGLLFVAEQRRGECRLAGERADLQRRQPGLLLLLLIGLRLAQLFGAQLLLDSQIIRSEERRVGE